MIYKSIGRAKHSVKAKNLKQKVQFEEGSWFFAFLKKKLLHYFS